ncbi:M4 family metallopeptidase [Massilia psychrophila]|uniref:Neutral metalloproteinase n=1 Tax=Massilia psychrophila TaxID=1603353 RepID=A0A2G8T5Q5_9BURK|nr:M4 family metallopeptidase [Massilia psychrophila]PIL40988.1 peptidase M4 family protein [Massilia psychrophila]GGE68654.1 peptidase [Massilia psychrophila]
MKIHKTLLAAAVSALPLLAIGTAGAAGAGPMMSPAVAQSPAQQAALLAALGAQRAVRGIDADHNFVISRAHPGADGTQVARLDHTYKGVPIFGSESVVVLGAAGKIVSESVSERRLNLGKGAANRTGAPTADFDVRPTISTKAAIDAALKSLPAGTSHVSMPSADLIIFPVMKTEREPGSLAKADDELNALDVRDVVDSYELAYLVHTRMTLRDRPVYHDTVVSARDGRILSQWNMLQTVIGIGHSQYNGAVPISTTFTGGSYRMIDATRGTGGAFGAMAITNANHTTSPGAVFSNTTNEWGDGFQYIEGGSTTNANGQTAAVNALWGLMNTYDMLKSTLGWLSLDGLNTATYIAAHVNTAYDNAYYSDTCKCMFIGDGSFFTNLGSIDVIGHEMGHGITAATSNLTYTGESGGLNESASDISGEMVESYARAGGTGATIPNTGNDWGMGKEIDRTGTPLRSMYKPSKDGRSPDAWSVTLKNLDVHYSSGPNNRMFYFLSQGSNAGKGSDFSSAYLVKKPLAMTGIGSDKAYRIWFKANTTKFTASTNYADARAKMIAAAQELYGVGGKEDKAVQRAYAAINVGGDIDE